VNPKSAPFSSSHVGVSDASLRFDQQMLQLSRLHATVLGFWASLNVVTGGILTFMHPGEVGSLAFHTMNLSWGFINGGIAAFVYFHTKKSAARPKMLLRRLNLQRHVEKVLLFNVGLDLAFVIAGIALYQRAFTVDAAYPELWKGFGTSVLIQAAYLLIQDSVFYRLHQKNRKKTEPDWKRRLDPGMDGS
jgi:multidrug transporter EmrE-like cation transporter